MRDETMMMPSAAQLSHAGPSQPLDRRPPRPGASGSGHKIDNAIVKLAERITANTVVQDHCSPLYRRVPNPASPSASGWVRRCPASTTTCGHFSGGRPLILSPGTVINKLSRRHLLILLLRPSTGITPPPFQQHTPPAVWQPGHGEHYHQGWPAFSQNLGLNTSGLSAIFDQAATPSGQMSSTLTTPKRTKTNLRPSSWASSTSDRPTSDVVRATESTLLPDPE